MWWKGREAWAERSVRREVLPLERVERVKLRFLRAWRPREESGQPSRRCQIRLISRTSSSLQRLVRPCFTRSLRREEWWCSSTDLKAGGGLFSGVGSERAAAWERVNS